MATYRQLPELFRRLHPEFQDPVALARRLRGVRPDPRAPARDRSTSSARCTRSARCSRSRSRTSSSSACARSRPTTRSSFRGRPNLRHRRHRLAALRRLGGLATGLAWLVVVVQTPPTRYAGLAWLAIGLRRLRRLPAAARFMPADGDRAGAGHARPGARRSSTARSSCRSCAGDAGGGGDRTSPRGSRPNGARRSSRHARGRGAARLPLDAEHARGGAPPNELLDEAHAIGELYGVRVVDAPRARATPGARSSRGRAEERGDHRPGCARGAARPRRARLRLDRRLRAEGRARAASWSRRRRRAA